MTKPFSSLFPAQLFIVISCSDLTTLFQPWAGASYLCYCVDLQHPPNETYESNIIHVGADVREWLPPYCRVAFAAFFPPRTDTVQDAYECLCRIMSERVEVSPLSSFSGCFSYKAL